MKHNAAMNTHPCGIIEHPLGICPKMELLDLEVGCFLIYWEINIPCQYPVPLGDKLHPFPVSSSHCGKLTLDTFVSACISSEEANLGLSPFFSFSFHLTLCHPLSSLSLTLSMFLFLFLSYPPSFFFLNNTCNLFWVNAYWGKVWSLTSGKCLCVEGKIWLCLVV